MSPQYMEKIGAIRKSDTHKKENIPLDFLQKIQGNICFNMSIDIVLIIEYNRTRYYRKV